MNEIRHEAVHTVFEYYLASRKFFLLELFVPSGTNKTLCFGDTIDGTQNLIIARNSVHMALCPQSICLPL